MHQILDGNDSSAPEDDDAPFSRALVRRCSEIADELGGTEALFEHFSTVLIETLDGRRNHLWSDPSEESFAAIALLDSQLDLGWNSDDVAVDQLMIELGNEGHYRSSFYRLGALRRIEVPLRAYIDALDQGELPEAG
jgi:hypothetical protein